MGFLRTFCRDPPIGSLQKLYGSGSSDWCDGFDPAVIAALFFFVWLAVRGSDHGYGVMVFICVLFSKVFPFSAARSGQRPELWRDVFAAFFEYGFNFVFCIFGLLMRGSVAHSNGVRSSVSRFCFSGCPCGVVTMATARWSLQFFPFGFIVF